MNDMKKAIVERLMDRKYIDDEKTIKDITVYIGTESGHGENDVYAVVDISVDYSNNDREIINLKAYEFEDLLGV